MPSHSLFDQVSHGSLGNKIFDILRDRILNEEYEDVYKRQFMVYWDRNNFRNVDFWSYTWYLYENI